MNLQSQLATFQEQSGTLGLEERAGLACSLAKELEEAGDYEAAREVLSEFWPRENSVPRLDGLERPLQAAVLQRVGALIGLLGSNRPGDEAQETAKNLISQSIHIFKTLGKTNKAIAAQSDLALCYWRQGAFDEARILFQEITSRCAECDEETGAIVLIRSAIVEKTAGRYDSALRMYKKAAPFVERTNNAALKGKLHNAIGTVLNCLAVGEQSEELIDRALVEFTAASFHFEQAGYRKFLAGVENNLGFLFFTVRRFKEAHLHLDRARRLFLEVGDIDHAAQADETRARTLLAEGRLREADRLARAAVQTLEKRDKQAPLAEALTTHGVTLARMGNRARSRALLQRAIQIAETVGDLEGAGRAHLSIIEEMGQQTSTTELVSNYKSAAALLQGSQDPLLAKRLIADARKVIHALQDARSKNQGGAEHSWDGFSYKKKILDSERSLIERALRDANGSVTRAARLLGFNHHQSLISLINSRHKELLETRTAVRKRRRHIFSKPRKIKTSAVPAERVSATVSILLADDDG
jgi:tetratricopeptide (TPR) repeat protein